MECLTIEQIYLFIENELGSEEALEVQKHLNQCHVCQNAVEERRVLNMAADTLPEFELPPNFTQQVMAKIYPSRIPLRVWIKALASGLVSMMFAFSLFYILSGKNLVDLFIAVNKFTLPIFRSLSTGIVKAFKLAEYLIKIVFQFFDYAIKSFGKLAHMLSPEVQIGIVTLFVIASTVIYFTVRKKIMFGEKA